MPNDFINSRFCQRWLVALTIVFSPGFFLSAAVTCVALYLSIVYKTNIPFSNTMAIVGSIFGGVAGAFFKDEYDKLSGKNILEKKGRSALRNLQGISTQLINIRSWVLEFGKRTRKQEDKRTLEEINRHITTIELNIASGLEDWVDIVPELKERTQKEAEIDKKYKDLLQSYFNELVEKRRELVTSTDEKRVGELKKKISDLEKQINEVREERPRVVTASGIGFGGGSVVGVADPGIFNMASFGSRKCAGCGKKFTPDYCSVSGMTITGGMYCNDCANGGETVIANTPGVI